MATVLFQRGDTDKLNSLPRTDGLIYFNTDDKRIYVDSRTSRDIYGGFPPIIDNLTEATDSNVLSASASANLFPQKTSIVDSNPLAVTSSQTPLGCVGFKSVIGTTNISGIGNGTVTGAIDNINTRFNSVGFTKLWQNAGGDDITSISLPTLSNYSGIMIIAMKYTSDQLSGGQWSDDVYTSDIVPTTIKPHRSTLYYFQGELIKTYFTSGTIQTFTRGYKLYDTSITFDATCALTEHTGTNTWTSTSNSTHLVPYAIYGFSPISH